MDWYLSTSVTDKHIYKLVSTRRAVLRPNDCSINMHIEFLHCLLCNYLQTKKTKTKQEQKQRSVWNLYTIHIYGNMAHALCCKVKCVGNLGSPGRVHVTQGTMCSGRQYLFHLTSESIHSGQTVPISRQIQQRANTTSDCVIMEKFYRLWEENKGRYVFCIFNFYWAFVLLKMKCSSFSKLFKL